MKSPESYLELLKIDVQSYPVIAVVGGVGKTSLIFRLTEELRKLNKKVVITTTTHMKYEPERPFAPDGDAGLVRELLEQEGYVIAGRKDENGKISGVSEECLRNLRELCDVLLVEADGARNLPIKVPETWEPVIPDIADLVISVVGLDCLGRPIRETSHRMDRTANFLRKSLDAPITPDDVVKIASSICGLFKDVEDRIYRVYLNKADVLTDPSIAEEIVESLEEKHFVAACGSTGVFPEGKE